MRHLKKKQTNKAKRQYKRIYSLQRLSMIADISSLDQLQTEKLRPLMKISSSNKNTFVTRLLTRQFTKLELITDISPVGTP